LAFSYLDNANKTKNGSLLSTLQTQQSLKNNQYPLTITDVNNVLSGHCFDIIGDEKHQSRTSKEEESNHPKDEEKPELSFAMMEGKCYCCSKAGHKSPTCRLKDKIEKHEWAINKAKAKETKEQSHMNNEKEKFSTSDNSYENKPTPGWSGAHVQFYQAQDMKKWILLDNGSTVNLFCNPNMVSDIKETNETL
jgi:hypothetical protein